MSSAPPQIFSRRRRVARAHRHYRTWKRDQGSQFIREDMAKDIVERLEFMRVEPCATLIHGDWPGFLGKALIEREFSIWDTGPDSLDEEAPYPDPFFSLIVSLCALDTVNDLPGALIHIREALQPGGLAIASFVGAGSLEHLRAAMLAADGERPAARMHPAVDVRAGGQLLQRAGWKDPVVDSHTISVSYSSLDRLVADLRAQGLGNVLASYGPPLGKAALERARTAFLNGEERVTERFEIITLSGWKT